MVFFLNTLQELPLREEGLSEQNFLMTPLQTLLMYDLPPAFEQLERIVEKYELTDQKITDIPPEVKKEIETVNRSPYWKGIYNWIVAKIKGEDGSLGEGPLFIQIRKGSCGGLPVRASSTRGSSTFSSICSGFGISDAPLRSGLALPATFSSHWQRALERTPSSI